jgi:hypothetical protein
MATNIAAYGIYVKCVILAGMVTDNGLSMAASNIANAINQIGFGLTSMGTQIAEAMKYAADRQVECAQLAADAEYVNESRRLSA